MSLGYDFFNLAKKQADLFTNNHLAWVEVLVTGTALRGIMRIAYRRLIREGKMIPLENMHEEEKNRLWETVEEFDNGRNDEQGKVYIAISLLTLEYFLQ